MKYRKKGKTFENPCFDWLIKMNINVTDDVTNFYFYTKKHFHNNLSMKVKIEQKKQNSRYFFFFFFFRKVFQDSFVKGKSSFAVGV